MKKGREEQENKVDSVSCAQECLQCDVGNHHLCTGGAKCNCTNPRTPPKGWRARLRELFPISGAKRPSGGS